MNSYEILANVKYILFKADMTSGIALEMADISF